MKAGYYTLHLCRYHRSMPMRKAGLAAAILVTCLAAQAPPQIPEVLRIQQYVSRVNADKSLSIAQVYHEALSRKSTFPYPVLSIDGEIFYPYNTDYPCLAFLYHSATDLQKIKEVINVGSGFAVNYYYLRNNRLVSIEAKEIACSFWKQSAKIRYTEKDYSFHGRYFFANDSCISQQVRGEIRFSGIHISENDSLNRAVASSRAHFYQWQANRYVNILKGATAN